MYSHDHSANSAEGEELVTELRKRESVTLASRAGQRVWGHITYTPRRPNV